MSDKQEKIEVESFADLFAEQIKIDELQDEKLLRLWHGNNYSKSAR